MHKTYRLDLPEQATSCAVFSSPHSGAAYPQAFLASARLDKRAIRSSEDAFVDTLFANAPLHGAPLLAAKLPRAYVDLNRGADELDPALVEGAVRRGVSPRIAAGLGVIPRVVSEGKIIRDGKISLQEAEERLRDVYQPYHDRLRLLLNEQIHRFGHAVLFDCHSMPHDALAAAPRIRGGLPNIILGDRFGTSCHRWLMDGASKILTSAGFKVTRNAPFAGGYITQHYGRPSLGVHALQIEIDRALYMDERRIEPNGDFDDVAARLSGAVAALARLGAEALPLAAE